MAVLRVDSKGRLYHACGGLVGTNKITTLRETKLRNLGVEITADCVSSPNSSLNNKLTLTAPSRNRFQAYDIETNWRGITLGTPITNESDISTTSSIQINRRVTNPKGFALFSQPLPTY
jgi:hypothetical protein